MPNPSSASPAHFPFQVPGRPAWRPGAVGANRGRPAGERCLGLRSVALRLLPTHECSAEIGQRLRGALKP
jgi:hypothetical protein